MATSAIALGLEIGLPFLLRLADKFMGGKHDALGDQAGGSKLSWVATAWKALQDIMGGGLTIDKARSDAQDAWNKLNPTGQLVGHGTVLDPLQPSSSPNQIKQSLRIVMQALTAVSEELLK